MIFVDNDGEKHIKVPVGTSILEAAHENDIELEGNSLAIGVLYLTAVYFSFPLFTISKLLSNISRGLVNACCNVFAVDIDDLALH